MWIISCCSLCLTMECPCLWSGSTVRRKKSFWGSPLTGSWGCPSTTATTSKPGGSTPSRHGTSTGKPSTWWFRCGHEPNFPLFAYSQQKPSKATPAGILFLLLSFRSDVQCKKWREKKACMVLKKPFIGRYLPCQGSCQKEQRKKYPHRWNWIEGGSKCDFFSQRRRYNNDIIFFSEKKMTS